MASAASRTVDVRKYLVSTDYSTVGGTNGGNNGGTTVSYDALVSCIEHGGAEDEDEEYYQTCREYSVYWRRGMMCAVFVTMHACGRIKSILRIEPV